ncbi:MAG: hypothetical protein RMI94_14105 [Bryobacterales bacterium]|nr:hypothetical protein [Bryobacteraceae bacterium]MDW8131681.1 hypothetical protein [Bryobacterales bacterium]
MRGPRAWLIPDVALVGALVTLGYCLLLWDGPRRLFRDADTGWHIRTGEWIVSHGRLPRADPYSFSRSGAPWVAWEWGADLLMGGIHRLTGLSGIAWLYAVAIGASVWLWFRLHWQVGGDFLLACAMAPPMLSTANLHWLARPHVFGWIFTLLAVWRCERAGTRFRLREAALVAAASALWANLHASFFLGPLIAAIYAAGHWVAPRLWREAPSDSTARARWLAWAAAASLAGTLLNPYGWRLHWHVARYLADRELLARIGEFQTFNFHAEGAGQILLAVGLAGLGAAAALAGGRPSHFLALVLLVAGSLRVARLLPLVALVGLPLANGAITAALRRAAVSDGLREGVRRRLRRLLEYSARLRALDRWHHGALWATIVPLAAWLWLMQPSVRARTGFPPDQFPLHAAEAVQRLPADAKLLSTDKFGGFLIYRFAGRRKVFFDGRSDFYGAEFLKRYGRLMAVRPGWPQTIEAYGFTHALLPPDSSLAAALQAAGWRRLAEDRAAVLLERP